MVRQSLPDRGNRSSIKLHLLCVLHGYAMSCVRTLSEPAKVRGQISISIKYSCGIAVSRRSCASQGFLPYFDGTQPTSRFRPAKMITPLRKSPLHPIPDLELQDAAFMAAQGLMVSRRNPNQRAGLIPLTCSICHTIVLSHRASQVRNS
jgi:hypothetical protein